MKLKIEVETKSRLYIGGIPQGYSLGGIDMITATQEGKPYIPASSFKGALREICRDYKCTDIEDIYPKDKYPDVKEPLNDSIFIPRHLFVFGIPGVNRSPKLAFSDLILAPKHTDPALFFSLESKNTITESDDGKIAANPRTYKAAASELTFIGHAWLRGFTEKQQGEEKLLYSYIKNMAEKFNDGEYRLGNSKSRGYGHIQVQIDKAEG
ncbi:MAG: RAMP superfamily CRISPR-associated protein [Clostridiales Family XIII bacterium]|jgi:CRISPR-associated protein Csm3|nr:RAMP superfamily CRISPR-associated protein [Clostridiales Family XIII bacterium]